MTNKFKITSKSQLKEKENFNLNNFNKLFCENEKKNINIKKRLILKIKNFGKKIILLINSEHYYLYRDLEDKVII